MIEAKTDVSQLPINQVLCGDCVDVMKTLPDESINMTMFSPPYYGLRDYGISGQIGLEEHPSKYVEKMVEVCREIKRISKKTGSMYIVIGDTYYGSGVKDPSDPSHGKMTQGSFCAAAKASQVIQNKYRTNWLQPKQLLGIPWRVAVALQEDGWILRNDIIWNKPNHMPSSVKDRLTNAYEHIFHFVRSRKYYYNLDAIREKHSTATMKRITQPNVMNQAGGEKQDTLRGRPSKGNASRCNLMVQNIAEKYKGKFDGFKDESEKYGSPRARTQRKYNGQDVNPSEGHIRRGAEFADAKKEGTAFHMLGKNPSDVLLYDSKYAKHQYGQTLQAFVREQTIAKRRLVSRAEAEKLFPNSPKKQQEYINYIHDHDSHMEGKNPSDFWNITTKPFKGAHFAVYPEDVCIRPIKSSCSPDGIVLDPMCGSGTTLAVAKKLGRKYIGIELNPVYIEIATKRLNAIPEKITTFF